MVTDVGDAPDHRDDPSPCRGEVRLVTLALPVVVKSARRDPPWC
jgi:hypothetical protein